MRKRSRPFDPRLSMRRPDFEVFHYHDPKMQEVPLHHHDFFGIYCFLGSRVEYLAEGRSYALEPGDLLLISPMELHRPKVAPDEAYERIVLWIDTAYLRSIDSPDGALHHCFVSGRNLYRSASSAQPGSALCAQGLFFQLMGELLRSASIETSEEDDQTESPLVARVLAYIGEHFREDLGLDRLAAHFFVSKYCILFIPSIQSQRRDKRLPLHPPQTSAACQAAALRASRSGRSLPVLRLSRLCELLPKLSRRLWNEPPESGRIIKTPAMSDRNDMAGAFIFL